MIDVVMLEKATYQTENNMEGKKVFIQVQCTEEEREAAKRIAKGRGIDVSKMVRLWIKKAVKREEAA